MKKIFNDRSLAASKERKRLAACTKFYSTKCATAVMGVYLKLF
jgi:hypothetical protein